MENKSYNSLDIVRLIMAILVVASHVLPFGSGGGIIAYLNYGVTQYLARVAVPFFFTVSGFFYAKRMNNQVNEHCLRKFVKKLLKLYIVWSIIYLPFSIKTLIEKGYSFFGGVIQYSKRIVLTGTYMHLWYLPAMIVAILLVSLLVKYNTSDKYLTVIAVILYVVGTINNAYEGAFLPIVKAVPVLDTANVSIQSVFETTRNGLFFGLPYVVLGVLLSKREKLFTLRKSIIGFIVSMILLLMEVFAVRKISGNPADMYLMALPSTAFIFMTAQNIKLPDNKIYPTIRKMSSFIYFVHPIIAFATKGILGDSASQTPLLFMVTLAITLLLSYLIVCISTKKHFAWINKVLI